MRTLLLLVTAILPGMVLAQLGLKAGYNYANITKASSINADSRSGFHIGGFLSPSSKGLFSSRTEVIFSRQGYSFETSGTSGNVDLDYVILPQLMGINITKLLQVQAGFQMAYLLNAKADSSSAQTNGGGSKSIMDYYNRFDYAIAAGVELHPFKGLLVGARANFGLGKLYKQQQAGQIPAFIPKVNTRNNVIQVFAGWRFGK